VLLLLFFDFLTTEEKELEEEKTES